MLDSRFRIPGTQIRVGVEALLGLIPGLGDFVGFALSLLLFVYFCWLGLAPSVLLRVATYLAADFLIGMIPVVGDLIDIAFRANLRSVRLARHYLEDSKRAIFRSRLYLTVWTVSIFLLLIASLAGGIYGFWWLADRLKFP